MSDHGSIIVIAISDKTTEYIEFSVDEGNSWIKIGF